MRALCLLACLVPALSVFAGPAVSAPIQVQPILVCDDAGNNCAGGDPTSSSSIYSQLFRQDVLDKIFAQTAGIDDTGTSFPGVSFTILKPTVFKDSRYLTTDVGALSSSDGSLVTNPVDEAHQLIRLPGHSQSSNANTLNVFLVDTLRATVDGAPSGATVHGYGLTSSNGAIIDTGGSPDTLAHELGHNLGLTHVDGKSYDSTDNLMRSAGRDTTLDIGQMGTVYDRLSGSADNDQIARANAPLFTVNLASGILDATDSTGGGICQEGVTRACDLVIRSNVGATAESLIGVKIRWLDGSWLKSGVTVDVPLHAVVGPPFGWIEESGCDWETDTRKALTGSAVEIDLGFRPGCLLPPRWTNLGIGFDVGGPRYVAPFSVEYDFEDGSTSTGLYDATTGTAVSPATVTVGAIDRSIAGGPDEFVEFGTVVVVPVPEPASLALLGAALVLAAAGTRAARRRSPAPP